MPIRYVVLIAAFAFFIGIAMPVFFPQFWTHHGAQAPIELSR